MKYADVEATGFEISNNFGNTWWTHGNPHTAKLFILDVRDPSLELRLHTFNTEIRLMSGEWFKY